MTGCYDCGLPYGEPGWIETSIPDKVWNDISPTGDEGGILCITCIARRLTNKGYKRVPVWLVGTEPLRPAGGDPSVDESSFYILRTWKPNIHSIAKGWGRINPEGQQTNKSADMEKEEP